MMKKKKKKKLLLPSFSFSCPLSCSPLQLLALSHHPLQEEDRQCILPSKLQAWRQDLHRRRHLSSSSSFSSFLPCLLLVQHFLVPSLQTHPRPPHCRQLFPSFSSSSPSSQPLFSQPPS